MNENVTKISWHNAELLDNSVFYEIIRINRVATIKGFFYRLFLVILGLGLGIMFYLFEAPIVITILSFIPLLFAALFFVSDIINSNTIKQKKFTWHKTYVKQKIYKTSSGHQKRNNSYVVTIDDIYCDFPQPFHIFSENDEIYVINFDNKMFLAYKIK